MLYCSSAKHASLHVSLSIADTLTTTIKLTCFGLPRPSSCLAICDQESTDATWPSVNSGYISAWYNLHSVDTESRKFNHMPRKALMLSGLLNSHQWLETLNAEQELVLQWQSFLQILARTFRNWIISLCSNASGGFLSACSFFNTPVVCAPNSQASTGQLSSWRESGCAALLFFSASNFTDHWSSYWKTCARSSNRRWIEVLSDWNLVRNTVVWTN